MMKNSMILTVFVMGLGSIASAQQPDVTDRPAQVQVTFSNSKTYVGSYTGRAVSRVCGQTDPMYFGHKSFVFEYPLDLPPNDPIEDIRFSSDDLIDGKKVTAKFHLSVTVSSPAMGHPSALVIDTENPNSKASGDANISGDAKEMRITVTGTNSLAEKVDLRVSCGPAPKK